MKINKYFSPVILLAVFFLVIAVGMIGGYWQTHGGGRRGHASVPSVPTSIVLAQDVVGG